MLGKAGHIVVLGDVDGDLVLQTAVGLQGLGIEATGIRLDVTKAGEWAEACAADRAALGRPGRAGEQRGSQLARDHRDDR